MSKKSLMINTVLALLSIIVLGLAGLTTANAAPPIIARDATLVIDNRTGHDIVVNIEEKIVEESWNEDLTKATLWVAADTQQKLMLRPADHKYNVGEVTDQLNFGDNGNGWFNIVSGDTLYLTCNAAGCEVMTPAQFTAMSAGSADKVASPADVSASANKGTLNFINETGHDVWIDIEEEIVNPLRAEEATKANVVVSAGGKYSFSLNPARHQFIVDQVGQSLGLGDNGNGVFDIAPNQTLTLRCNAAKCEFVTPEQLGAAAEPVTPADVSASANKGTLNFINETGHDVWIDIEEEIVNPLRAEEATKANVVVSAGGKYSFSLNPAHHQFIVDQVGQSLGLGDNGNGVFDIAPNQTLALRCNAAKCEFINAE